MGLVVCPAEVEMVPADQVRLDLNRTLDAVACNKPYVDIWKLVRRISEDVDVLARDRPCGWEGEVEIHVQNGYWVWECPECGNQQNQKPDRD